MIDWAGASRGKFSDKVSEQVLIQIFQSCTDDALTRQKLVLLQETSFLR